jgi:hypothetical protein
VTNAGATGLEPIFIIGGERTAHGQFGNSLHVPSADSEPRTLVSGFSERRLETLCGQGISRGDPRAERHNDRCLRPRRHAGPE